MAINNNFGFVPLEKKEVVEKEIQETPDFGFVPLEKKPEELTIGQKGRRHILRSLARAGESLMGLPGDIQQMASNLSKGLVKKVTGKDIPDVDFKLFPNLKTTGEMRELLKTVAGDYLEPKGKVEEAADEIISLGSTLALPGIGFGSVPRALTAAATGTLLKEGAKSLNAPEGVQNFMQFVGTFAGSKGLGGFKKYRSNLYKTSEKLLNPGATTSAAPLHSTIKNLRKFSHEGIPTPAKKAILTTTRETEKLIRNNRITVKALTELKKDLNEIINYELPKGRQGVLKQLNNKAGQLIQDYGKKQNPEFLKAYNQANKFYSEFAQANKMHNFFKSLKQLENYGLAGAVLTGQFKALPAILGAKGITAITETILTKPELRKYYFKSLQAAAKNNKTGALHYARKLNEQLEKAKNK